jgi:hypothetical protein
MPVTVDSRPLAAGILDIFDGPPALGIGEQTGGRIFRHDDRVPQSGEVRPGIECVTPIDLRSILLVGIEIEHELGTVSDCPAVVCLAHRIVIVVPENCLDIEVFVVAANRDTQVRRVAENRGLRLWEAVVSLLM